MRKFAFVSLSLFLLAFMLIVPAQAVEEDPDGVIPADQVINDDVFIGAETAVIDGTINGNCFVNASAVTVNGVVNGDLLIFSANAVVNGPVSGSIAFIGRSVKVNGPVGGSIYGAGAALWLLPEADVGRNVFFAGYALEVQPEARVTTDLIVNSAQASVAGLIGRDLKGNLDGFELAGKVARDVAVNVGNPQEGGFRWSPFGFNGGESPALVASGIRVSGDAEIGGQLQYTSSIEQGNTILAQPAGGIAYRVIEKPTWQDAFVNAVMARLRELVILAIFGALAVWLAPRWLQRSSEQVRRLFPALVWGVVVWVIGPLLAVLLLLVIILLVILFGSVTFGGLAWAAFSLGVGWFGLVMTAMILLGYVGALAVANQIGSWGVRRFMPAYQGHPYWPLLAGVVALTLLRAIPLLGWFVGLAVFLVGSGALWMAIRGRGAEAQTGTLPSSMEAS